LQFHDAIAKPDDQINADFDFWTAAVNLKDNFIKYSKAYHLHRSQWISSLLRQTNVKVNLVKGLITGWILQVPVAIQNSSEFTLKLSKIALPCRSWAAPPGAAAVSAWSI
jgi:hypothetical protein